VTASFLTVAALAARDQAAEDAARAEAAAAEAAAAEARAAEHDYEVACGALADAAHQLLQRVLGMDEAQRARLDQLTIEHLNLEASLMVLSDAGLSPGAEPVALAVTVTDTATASGEVWLVHHDDGWTRTAQVLSLSQLGDLLAARDHPPTQLAPATRSTQEA